VRMFDRFYGPLRGPAHPRRRAAPDLRL
jgi:hypothetical protein